MGATLIHVRQKDGPEEGNSAVRNYANKPKNAESQSRRPTLVNPLYYQLLRRTSAPSSNCQSLLSPPHACPLAVHSTNATGGAHPEFVSEFYFNYQRTKTLRVLHTICNSITGMRRVTTFRSTTDRIYDGGPIILSYYNTYHCVTIAHSIQYSNMLHRFVAYEQ